MFIINFIKNALHLYNNKHIHTWNLKNTYSNKSLTYLHEHFECKCGCHKHIFHGWNHKPEIKITRSLIGSNIDK